MRFDLHPFSSVDDARQWARTEIDAAAGSARSRFITTVPGQDSAYRAKYEEAHAFIAAGYSATSFAIPWIEAEASTAGITVVAAADRIRARGDAWNLVLGPRIEALRIGGKSQLADVLSVAAVVRTARSVMAQLAAVDGASAGM